VARQFHNQPEESHQHRFLVDLWDEVRRITAGKVDVTVHANNAGTVGSDPRVLDMLVAGEVEFATMMGPLIGGLVPAAEIQGVPFAFGTSTQAHAALDGALGDFLRSEMRAKGIHLAQHGALENGFRQICSKTKAVRGPEHLAGYRMRVPAGRILRELFEALGASAVVINIDGLYAALRDGRVDFHDPPRLVGLQSDCEPRLLVFPARIRAGGDSCRRQAACCTAAWLHRAAQRSARGRPGGSGDAD
jgi:TRAP-type C4-dicarboxylate transport system substrate-binding protein